MRKGWHELQNGINCIGNCSARGRKRCEEKTPKLVAHIREIVEASSQADPSMQSERLYIKMSCNQIRLQLKKCFQYDEADIPSKGAIRRILNENKYHLRKVRKTLPQK
ncbi:MAG: ISAzo13 family transposase, partial [Gammaproteobacteria bacterium]|nr:ISAzo13 family transposase [Gammaproteobacteria bacterium]